MSFFLYFLLIIIKKRIKERERERKPESIFCGHAKREKRVSSAHRPIMRTANRMKSHRFLIYRIILLNCHHEQSIGNRSNYSEWNWFCDSNRLSSREKCKENPFTKANLKLKQRKKASTHTSQPQIQIQSKACLLLLRDGLRHLSTLIWMPSTCKHFEMHTFSINEWKKKLTVIFCNLQSSNTLWK